MMPFTDFILGGAFLITVGILMGCNEIQASGVRLSRGWAIAQLIAILVCGLIVAAMAVKYGT